MTAFKSDFLTVLHERGLVHQCSDIEALDTLAAGGGLRAYAGFDATADSLHVGHLLPLVALRWLQRTGGAPVVLVGGATTLVGDPSFRDASRPLLDEMGIAANAASMSRAFRGVLSFEGDSGAVMVDNSEWLSGLGFIRFLREVGTHFTVSRMLSFDSVRSRMEREQSLTLLEFNYMVLQAFDFVELSRRMDCLLQLGGSDQWGNMINGIELARRTDRKELFALTTPLLATSSGQKMGKTAGGAVWLNPDRTSAFDFWQFWRNVEDADAGRFLALFTDLPMGEVGRLGALGGSEINVAKSVLADAVTALVHGAEAASSASAAAASVFERASGDGLPTVSVSAADLASGMPLVDLVARAGLAPSKSAARRLIEGGGIRVGGVKAEEALATVSSSDLDGGRILISLGRKRHVAVVAG